MQRVAVIVVALGVATCSFAAGIDSWSIHQQYGLAAAALQPTSCQASPVQTPTPGETLIYTRTNSNCDQLVNRGDDSFMRCGTTAAHFDHFTFKTDVDLLGLPTITALNSQLLTTGTQLCYVSSGPATASFRCRDISSLATETAVDVGSGDLTAVSAASASTRLYPTTVTTVGDAFYYVLDSALLRFNLGVSPAAVHLNDIIGLQYVATSLDEARLYIVSQGKLQISPNNAGLTIIDTAIAALAADPGIINAEPVRFVGGYAISTSAGLYIIKNNDDLAPDGSLFVAQAVLKIITVGTTLYVATNDSSLHQIDCANLDVGTLPRIALTFSNNVFDMAFNGANSLTLTSSTGRLDTIPDLNSFPSGVAGSTYTVLTSSSPCAILTSVSDDVVPICVKQVQGNTRVTAAGKRNGVYELTQFAPTATVHRLVNTETAVAFFVEKPRADTIKDFSYLTIAGGLGGTAVTFTVPGSAIEQAFEVGDRLYIAGILAPALEPEASPAPAPSPAPAVGTFIMAYNGALEQWRFEDSTATPDSLVVDPSVGLFIGTTSGVLALDLSGQVQWRYSAGGSVTLPMTLLSDGSLLCSVDTGVVLRVSAKGQLLGQFATSPTQRIVATVDDGLLYIVTATHLEARALSGALQWRQALASSYPPSLNTRDQSVLVAESNTVKAFSTSGTLLWTSSALNGNVASLLTLDAGGNVYCLSAGNHFYQLAADDGSTLIDRDNTQAATSSIFLNAQGHAYWSLSDGTLVGVMPALSPLKYIEQDPFIPGYTMQEPGRCEICPAGFVCAANTAVTACDDVASCPPGSSLPLTALSTATSDVPSDVDEQLALKSSDFDTLLYWIILPSFIFLLVVLGTVFPIMISFLGILFLPYKMHHRGLRLASRSDTVAGVATLTFLACICAIAAWAIQINGSQGGTVAGFDRRDLAVEPALLNTSSDLTVFIVASATQGLDCSLANDVEQILLDKGFTVVATSVASALCVISLDCADCNLHASLPSTRQACMHLNLNDGTQPAFQFSQVSITVRSRTSAEQLLQVIAAQQTSAAQPLPMASFATSVLPLYQQGLGVLRFAPPVSAETSCGPSSAGTISVHIQVQDSLLVTIKPEYDSAFITVAALAAFATAYVIIAVVASVVRYVLQLNISVLDRPTSLHTKPSKDHRHDPNWRPNAFEPPTMISMVHSNDDLAAGFTRAEALDGEPQVAEFELPAQFNVHQGYGAEEESDEDDYALARDVQDREPQPTNPAYALARDVQDREPQPTNPAYPRHLEVPSRSPQPQRRQQQPYAAQHAPQERPAYSPQPQRRQQPPANQQYPDQRAEYAPPPMRQTRQAPTNALGHNPAPRGRSYDEADGRDPYGARGRSSAAPPDHRNSNFPNSRPAPRQDLRQDLRQDPRQDPRQVPRGARHQEPAPRDYPPQQQRRPQQQRGGYGGGQGRPHRDYNY